MDRNLIKLKSRYRLLVILVTLIAITPILIAGIYNESFSNILTQNSFINSTADRYGIDLNECLKCQDNGLVFGIIFLIILCTLIPLSMSAMLLMVWIILRVLTGWQLSSFINVFVKGQYPKAWKT